MRIKIIEEKKNPLFSRREIHLEIESVAVPSHEEVKNLVSEKFSSDPKLIRTKLIKGRFGINIFDVFVDIYDSNEEFDRVVKKTKQELDKEKRRIEEESKGESEAKDTKEVSTEGAVKDEIKEEVVKDEIKEEEGVKEVESVDEKKIKDNEGDKK